MRLSDQANTIEEVSESGMEHMGLMLKSTRLNLALWKAIIWFVYTMVAMGTEQKS